MTTQTQIEQNEALLGAGLMQHLKSYIQLYVSQTADLQDVDITELSNKITQIVSVIDGDPESDGYQAFQSLLSDVATLKTDNTSNKQRLTAVEAALSAMDTAWRAEVARVETESQTRDTALGGRIDALQNSVSEYAATRLAKDVEHDAAIAGLEAAKNTIIQSLQSEVTRALAREAELNDAINTHTGEINAIAARESDYATRANVDSGFAAFCNGAVTELWAGLTTPAGLPTFTTAQ